MPSGGLRGRCGCVRGCPGRGRRGARRGGAVPGRWLELGPAPPGPADPTRARAASMLHGHRARPARARDGRARRTVGDAVDRAQVWEEEAVGEHEADPALLRREPVPPVVPHVAAHPHVAPGEGEHPGQGEHGRRLAAHVGAQDADDLACRGGERYVHLDRPARQADPGVETLAAVAVVDGWPHRSHRPRSTPSTSTLTASSMLLIEIATCGSRSSSTYTRSGRVWVRPWKL